MSTTITKLGERLDMKSLEGKTAVVTGASSGIGLAIAQRFAEHGAQVYMTARGAEKLYAAVESIRENATGIEADVSVLADLDRVYTQVSDDGRCIDVIVANAGGGSLSTLAESTPEHFDGLFNTNVRGTYFTVQKAVPLLNDNASVILISSIAADSGSAGFGVYAASKASIRSFARTWAVEMAPRGIRVNSISPGAVWTPQMGAGRLDPAEEAQVQAAIGRTIPMGRMAESAEIADAALFLASEQSKFITGSNMTVDGGQGTASQLNPN